MILRRRKKPDLWEKVRVWLWPRRSIYRSVAYIAKRVLRLSATPHAVALGFAAGVFASFTPYLGFHIIITVALCYLMAANVVSGLMGTLVGNPLTAPLIWGSTFTTGQWLLKGVEPASKLPQIHLDKLLHFDPANPWRMLENDLPVLWTSLLKPMTFGAFLVGVPVSILFYLLVYWASREFQERRRKRLAVRASLRLPRPHFGPRKPLVPGE
jgi:hypothetical protein